MDIYPAIDIKGGKCVRLTQGQKDKEKVYADDPLVMARRWKADGASHLHIVDLDGAFAGEMKSAHIAQRIVVEVDMFCEFGGGVRSLDDIEDLLSKGIKRVILGTKAYEDEAFIENVLKEFDHRVAVGLDAKNGKIAIKGWTEETEVTPLDLALKLQKMGAKTLIYTDIATDGMMSGPNLAGLEELLDGTNVGIIASGGVTSVADVVNIRKLEYKGVIGAIIGKALYEGTIKLRDVL